MENWMTDREKVIKGLELCSREPGQTIGCLLDCPYDGVDGCRMVLMREALALLKASKSSLEQVAENHGLTVDGVEFALSQYQTVICEITHGRMSKLSYYAKDILSIASDLQCEGCELKDAQDAKIIPIEEAQGSDYCWYENRFLNICIIVSAVMSPYCSSRPKTEFMSIGSQVMGFCYDDEYGSTWRCWDKEPSKEQREATPWG